MRGAIASLIRSRYPRIVTGRWGAPNGREADDIPTYWVGSEEVLTALGGINAKEANQIARELGIGNARSLLEHVRDMRPIPAPGE